MTDSYKKEIHAKFLLIFIIISTVAFAIGVLLSYAIAVDSKISRLSVQYIYEAVKGVSDEGLLTKLLRCLPVFLTDFKYLLFIFVSSFTDFAFFAMICVNSLRSLLLGYSCAMLTRMIKSGVIISRLPFLVCTFYLFLAVASAVLICIFCTNAYLFNKRRSMPFGCINLFKRKTTYIFFSEMLAFSGILLVITLLKSLLFF